MNLNKVRFYNLGALETVPGFGDNSLTRIPSRICNKLNDGARIVGLESVGVEIQFVSDAPNIDISISLSLCSDRGFAQVRIYKGNFLHDQIDVQMGTNKVFRITSPANFELSNDCILSHNGYSPNVWRIVFSRANFLIHGINTYGYDIRKPKTQELPMYSWLAYGSSITNSHLDGYEHIAAAKLRVGVQNKGLSGACHIEEELVDYIVDECDFDFITCELGINMRVKFTKEEFEKRVSYLINRLVELGKPAIIISIFPNGKSKEYANELYDETISMVGFDEVLERLVKETDSKMIKFINGDKILDDLNGLGSDLLHPSAYGHAIMGINLASYLKDFLCEFGIEL